MARSQAAKAQTHERILTEAAAQIRGDGLESVSVARLMSKVDLTHGGFYNHFESRADLLVQALERALIDGAARGRSLRNAGRNESFEFFVKHYLSRSHRDARKEGCALAALASDVARADEQTRAVMQDHFHGFVQHLENGMDSSADDRHAQALTAACTMIGGLLMSRVLTDTRESDALLKTLRQHLTPG